MLLPGMESGRRSWPAGFTDLQIDDLVEGAVHDFDGLGIGHPQAVFKTCFDLGLRKRTRNCFAAAMHDDHLDAGCMQEGNVCCHTRANEWVGVIHEGAAVFDNKDRVTEALDVGECLQQHGRLGDSVEVVGLCHVYERWMRLKLFALVEVYVGFTEVGGQQTEGAVALI